MLLLIIEGDKMNSKLIAYFSVTGKTKSIAMMLGELLCADVYEIKPQVLYTPSDLNRYDDNSRTTHEMHDPNIRPKMCEVTFDINNYTDIYIGYPIWWEYAPKIINTFIESVDLTNKNIFLFCTAESGNIRISKERILHEYPYLNIVKGKRFTEYDSHRDIERWLNE